jgi:hypothetical protein
VQDVASSDQVAEMRCTDSRVGAAFLLFVGERRRFVIESCMCVRTERTQK